MKLNKRLQELSQDIGSWANQNFKVHAPSMGVLEEVGETAHCIIKRRQGIRGFDKDDHFKAQLTDALADVAIYGMHFAFKNQISFLSMEPIEHEIYSLSDAEVDSIMGRFAENAAQLLQAPAQTFWDSHLEDLFCNAATIAKMHGIDFEEAIEKTAAKVLKRDWVANPVDADKKVDTAA